VAVILDFADVWLVHLPFVGGPRPSPFGPVDGVWYGAFSADGDATGGVVRLRGDLSFDRKEDWVYILGAVNSQVNVATAMDGFIVVNTGPRIPTATVVANPSFLVVGVMAVATALLATSFNSNAGGMDPRSGMPIFGDKKISGDFAMMEAGFEVNVDGAVYTVSSWGFLIRYNSFFRNLPAGVG